LNKIEWSNISQKVNDKNNLNSEGVFFFAYIVPKPSVFQTQNIYCWLKDIWTEWWKLPSIGHCFAGQYVLGRACLLGLFCIRSTYLLSWAWQWDAQPNPNENSSSMADPNKAFSLLNSWGTNKKSRTLYEVCSFV
jgi:hypothetical protein